MDCAEYLMILQWKLFTEIDQMVNIEMVNIEMMNIDTENIEIENIETI